MVQSFGVQPSLFLSLLGIHKDHGGRCYGYTDHALTRLTCGQQVQVLVGVYYNLIVGKCQVYDIRWLH